MAGKISLRLRKLDDGSLLIGEFPGKDEALAWLRERPHMMEVIGVAAELDPADEEQLRKAMRELDPDERKRSHELDEARLAAMRAAVEREQARMNAEVASGSDADLDPNRAMTVAFDEHEGIRNADPSDSREVPDIVKAAVVAWVTERNSWVHARGQHVARALVTVWPGPVPGGDEADRCQTGGQFETGPGAVDPPN
ncbi:MAG TPA: hypothetical protein VG755_14085 [Nannocystaceae bacterium]|nr:hypothetical protein [Nannocystaceae bacterium]